MFDDSRPASSHGTTSTAAKSLARLAAEEAFSAPREAPVIERIPSAAPQPSAATSGFMPSTSTPTAPPAPLVDTRAPRVFRVAPASIDALPASPAAPPVDTPAEPAAPMPRQARPVDTRKPGPVHVVYNAPARPMPVMAPPPAVAPSSISTARDDNARIQAGLDRALADVATSEFKDLTRRLDALKLVLGTIEQARSFRVTDAI